ncbi:MAG: UDP-N-acetylglucosamine 1-carboxyvinyltransferase [Clostridia bacterium]|nr:UDP-N-acetylglucosamine 1-carboxyvinyltransferase [Clostridia bacterium]
MSKYIINGKKPLRGSIKIHGAKNAVLPVLAASVVSGRESLIHNCPELSDVTESLEILRVLGCRVKMDSGTVTVDSGNLITNEVPGELMLKMRSSVIFLGALIARCKSGRVTLPGGCEIGPRPIDLHLKALRDMGIEIEDSGGIISCDARNMKSAHVHLEFPSVGATENVMLAATGARGITKITNAAKEPEIVDLQKYLNAAGFRVSGAGTDTVYIEGATAGKSAEHTIIPDRIEAATYASAILMTGGKAELCDVCPEHMQAFLSALKDCGAGIEIKNRNVLVEYKSRLKSVKHIRTQPYPGFPTDMQSVFMSLMTLSDGTSVITENIFKDRFRHVDGLVRMGADIVTDGNVAIIRGKKELFGASVSAGDLRGGAALTIAALAAEGKSTVDNLCYIDRGYERFEENLGLLGADIQRM